MGLILFFLLGLVAMFLVIILRKPVIHTLGRNKLAKKLQQTAWFQNAWLAGLFLLMMNAILFFGTLLVLDRLTNLFIPYIHLLVMVLAVIGSLYLWASINKGWNGSRNNRLKMGSIGSSFYLFLMLYFLYRLVTLEPSYPGEDPFMAVMGLMVAIIVTSVAFITCFSFTAFAAKQKSN